MGPTSAATTHLLVTGATGMQGGAVTRAALAAGIEVTALVRNPDSPAARSLADLGVRLSVGRLEDSDSLGRALEGIDAVFSVQPAPARLNPDSERIQGSRLVQAAADAGVRHLVHTSVSGTRWRAQHPGTDAGVMTNYWDSKEYVEDAVRASGLSYTIVKPAFFLDNFIPPKSPQMFPLLMDGELLVACAAETKVAVIGSDEFGRVVTAVLLDPLRFTRAEIELASDSCTYPEMASGISAATGHPVFASCETADVVDARLGVRSWSPTQVWLNEVGYPALPEHAEALGLTPRRSFLEWARDHESALSSQFTA